MFNLTNKTVIVTGAGSGIGRGCAIALAAAGANVALTGRRRPQLEETAHAIGGKTLVLPADVTRQSDIDRVIAQAAAHFGNLNILINNAGVLHVGNAEAITAEQWDHTFNVNVRAVWLFSRSVLPAMRKAHGGSIINVASVLGINAARNRAAYASSKGAVVLLSKSMAIDYAPEVIRQAPDPEAVRRERVAAHPLGRFGKPEDVATLAVYLASDEASWVTGAIFPVDGGYLAV